ncbi:MAG TPA: cytochrome c [Trueperaceae bacterium]|nr:cytochrome c [Trueperaceae bacterium]
MSGQGSSSSDTVVRVEIYLDDATEAVRVLSAPPFRFQLDSSALEQGEHILRLVRVDAAGGRRERRIPFNVQHEPAVEVVGLEAGATVTGRIDVDVAVPAAAAPPRVRPKGPSLWLYIVSTVVVLGGIWAFFMLVPMYSAIVSAPASGQVSASPSGASAPPVDQQLLKTGETLYASDCAACHKPSGEGMPPTFPALAGNSFLSDPTAVVKRIYDGSGAMPSHHSYTATQLAAVSTYVRNTWGNGYGGVTVKQASEAAPQASAGASTPSSSPSSSSGASGSGAGAPSTASSSAPSSTPSTAGSSTASGGASGSSGSASPSASAPAPAGSGAASPSSAAMQAGQKLYTSDCQSCHQPNGAGMPPTFPALAGDSFLSDPAAVVKRIYEGKGVMPSHPSYTAQELADVATYIRNAFGNDFGPVSVQQAKRAAPKAAQ